MDVYSELVESLERCLTACNNCAVSSLEEEHVQSMTDCIKLNLDCADICDISLKLLARDSNQSTSAVQLCKNICAECAEECEKYEHEHCQQCADFCRRCESQCGMYIEYMADLVSTA